MLNGEQLERIHEAIIHSFTSEELEWMVHAKLDESLDNITDGNNLKEVTFKLIKWAERTGNLSRLISGARESNIGNPKLVALERDFEQWRLTDPDLQTIVHLGDDLKWRSQGTHSNGRSHVQNLKGRRSIEYRIVLVSTTGVIIAALITAFPALYDRFGSVKETASTSIDCDLHGETDEQTFKNIIEEEEKAVAEGDISVIQKIFMHDALYEDKQQGEEKTINAIDNYAQAFKIFDYEYSNHGKISVVKIDSSVAYVTSGNDSRHIQKNGSGTAIQVAKPPGSDHWTFQKDRDGCWKIRKLVSNAGDVPFPP